MLEIDALTDHPISDKNPAWIFSTKILERVLLEFTWSAAASIIEIFKSSLQSKTTPNVVGVADAVVDAVVVQYVRVYAVGRGSVASSGTVVMGLISNSCIFLVVHSYVGLLHYLKPQT